MTKFSGYSYSVSIQYLDLFVSCDFLGPYDGEQNITIYKQVRAEELFIIQLFKEHEVHGTAWAYRYQFCPVCVNEKCQNPNMYAVKLYHW